MAPANALYSTHTEYNVHPMHVLRALALLRSLSDQFALEPGETAQNGQHQAGMRHGRVQSPGRSVWCLSRKSLAGTA